MGIMHPTVSSLVCESARLLLNTRSFLSCAGGDEEHCASDHGGYSWDLRPHRRRHPCGEEFVLCPLCCLIFALIFPSPVDVPVPGKNQYSSFSGFSHLAAGLACGLSSLAAGLAIGVVGDAGVRAIGQQVRFL